MSKEIETHVERLHVARDMVCTITFDGPRSIDSQDLQNLIAQLDMKRAVMDGENFTARANITTGAPAERKHMAARQKQVVVTATQGGGGGRPSDAKPYNAGGGGVAPQTDDGLTIPISPQQPPSEAKNTSSVLGKIKGFVRPADTKPQMERLTPEELAKRIDDVKAG